MKRTLIAAQNKTKNNLRQRKNKMKKTLIIAKNKNKNNLRQRKNKMKKTLIIAKNKTKNNLRQRKNKMKKTLIIAKNKTKNNLRQRKNKMKKTLIITKNKTKNNLRQRKNKMKKILIIAKNKTKNNLRQRKNKMKKTLIIAKNKTKNNLRQRKNKMKKTLIITKNKTKNNLRQRKNKMKKTLIITKNKTKNNLRQRKNKMKKILITTRNKIKQNLNLLINKFKLKLKNNENNKEIKKYKNEKTDFLKKIKKHPKQTMCFINSPKTEKFDICKECKKIIFNKNIKVFFKYAIYKKIWIEDCNLWEKENIKYFNHVGRETDSDEYKFCQNYVKELIYDLKLSNNELNNIFQTMKETIALQSADYYVSLLRYLILIDEVSKKEKYENILIVSSDIQFSLSLSFLLEKHGFSTFVLKPPSLSEKKYYEIKNRFINNYFDNLMHIPQKNIDLDTELNRLKGISDKQEKDFILTPFRINDNVYFQSLGAVAGQIDKYNFIGIDRFDDEKTYEKLKKQTLPDNFTYFPISSKVAFLEFNEKVDLENDLIEYFKNKTLFAKQYKLFDLNNYFLIYGLQIVKNQLLRAIYYYKLYETFFNMKKPKAVLSSPSRTIEARAAIEAANSHKILTFDLQGGTISASNRFWTTNAKYMLCFEKFSYSTYINFFKLKKENVFLVGSPRLDNDMLIYKKRRSLKKDKIKILVALQTLSSEINTKIVKTCEEAIKGLDSFELYISFHPGDSTSNKQPVIDALSPYTKISDRRTLDELVDTNICITYFSTIGLEAFALGCKVIALNVIDKNNWIFRLSDIGIASEAYDSKELRNLLLSKEGKHDNESFEILTDGKSSERILNLIETLE